MARFGHSIGIGDITVDKAGLIETLRSNRATHRETFLQACEVFRNKAVSELNAVMDAISNGKIPSFVGVHMPIPEEHTDDYDRAVAMLQRHIGDTVVLTEQAYAQLVDDDWGWRESFTSNTVSYASLSESPRL